MHGLLLGKKMCFFFKAVKKVLSGKKKKKLRVRCVNMQEACSEKHLYRYFSKFHNYRIALVRERLVLQVKYFLRNSISCRGFL